jgi:hypothetical protein
VAAKWRQRRSGKMAWKKIREAKLMKKINQCGNQSVMLASIINMNAKISAESGNENEIMKIINNENNGVSMSANE